MDARTLTSVHRVRAAALAGGVGAALRHTTPSSHRSPEPALAQLYLFGGSERKREGGRGQLAGAAAGRAMSSESGSDSGHRSVDDDGPVGADEDTPAYVPMISPPTRVSIVETLKRVDLKGKEYTAYRMKVLRLSGEVNVLDQRYQFFHDLNESLLAAGLVPEGAQLPGQKWFSKP